MDNMAIKKRIITYGTFDLFHVGHRKLLERAKKKGDYLIIGITSDNYDISRGKLNVDQSLSERIKGIKNIGIADKIIIEEYEGQKIDDIKKYSIDLFVIGDDWKGKFNYLNKYCEVVYLPRTKDISSTEIRNNKNTIINIGISGTGRIANRFVPESKFVSGINISANFSHSKERAENFSKEHQINHFTNNYITFLSRVDAVYIASTHKQHYFQAIEAINAGKHVLIEKPATLTVKEFNHLQELSSKNKVVLIEAIKTAYSPAFLKLIEVAKSGMIGDICDITACFTKLINNNTRELKKSDNGGSFNELASYTLLPIIKLLGCPKTMWFQRINCINGVDSFAKAIFGFDNAFAISMTGLKVKREGDLVIAGSKGYIYVPSPWWKTQYFEVRYEDINLNKQFFYKFDDDGLRYEIAEFCKCIKNGDLESKKLTHKDSFEIIKIIEQFNTDETLI